VPNPGYQRPAPQPPTWLRRGDATEPSKSLWSLPRKQIERDPFQAFDVSAILFHNLVVPKSDPGEPLKFSQTIEDYLKSIYLLAEDGQEVTTGKLAEALGVRPASVTGMIKKLAALRLLRHVRYRGVVLTESGRAVALEVIRHHRLLELFLVEELGYSWDEVHEEADRLEHFISEDFEEKMDRILGNPEVDPHGDPIPTKEGRIAARGDYSLADMPEGQAAEIIRVGGDQTLLRYAASLGLLPRASITYLEAQPFGGSLRILIEDREESVGRELARNVFVKLKDNATA
jgi:DtxR family transcriptional regulator, Mn-dependent transcriptional regulator